MAGLYLHIPFCKQACHYCDFHFSTQQKYRPQVVEALNLELVKRASELRNIEVDTIYFGGGTPSLLSDNELLSIFQTIESSYSVSSNPEITFEVNPDDVKVDKLIDYRSLGINRLSIGVQSFDDKILSWMNRAHTAQMSDYAIKLAQDKGFDNITIDLIYGVEHRSIADWRKEIQKAVEFNVPHISAYHLTIEKGTAFGNWFEKGKLKEVDEYQSEEEFKELIRALENENFQHYEISNFAKEEKLSKHNTSYWFGEKYIGIGPSAHSFNGKNRRWNISNNHKYVESITSDSQYWEEEILSEENKYNELVMTRLRTMFGLKVSDIPKQYQLYFLTQIQLFIDKGWVNKSNDLFTLTKAGKLRADYIASELFFIK